jgi:hypothetical protein
MGLIASERVKCVCQLPQADGASSLAPWDFRNILLWVTFGGDVVCEAPLTQFSNSA